MSAPNQPASIADRLRRLLAVGCAALVLALTVFAASPVAHESLHDHTDGHAAESDDCAVVMFASGVSLPVGPLAIAPPIPIGGGDSRVEVAEIFLVSPRYLRHPERGPPLSLVG